MPPLNLNWVPRYTNRQCWRADNTSLRHAHFSYVLTFRSMCFVIIWNYTETGQIHNYQRVNAWYRMHISFQWLYQKYKFLG